MDGRFFVEALKYVLLACPKAKENETLSRVVFEGNRIIAGDSYRWHIVYLPDGVKLRPVVATRASVEKLKRALNGIVPPKTSEERVRVDMVGLVVELHDGDEPVVRTLDAWQSGMWPETWEPEVPADTLPVAPISSEFDSKYVREATSWKDAISVWRGKRGGIACVDTMIGDERIAMAVLLPTGESVDVPADPRQADMFPTTQPLSALDKPSNGVAAAMAGFQKLADKHGSAISVSVNGGPKVTLAEPSRPADKLLPVMLTVAQDVWDGATETRDKLFRFAESIKVDAWVVDGEWRTDPLDPNGSQIQALEAKAASLNIATKRKPHVAPVPTAPPPKKPAKAEKPARAEARS